jgi:hypothetical protein
MKFITIKLIFTLSAFLLAILGLGMTLATTAMLGNFGYDANPASIHMARAAGGATLAIAVMVWLARKSAPSQARNALIIGLAVFFLLEAIVDLRGIMAGTVGPDGWYTGVLPWLVFFALTVIAGRSAMSETES